MIRAFVVSVFASLLAIAVPALAQDPSPADQAAVRLALQRGQLIYAYDQAAWHGTDDMQTKIADPAKVIGGWIVDGPASNPELIFFDRNVADPHAVYVANFQGNRLVSSRVLDANEDRTLSPQRKAMIYARRKGLDAAIAAKPLYCSQSSPNTVVLPPEQPGGPYLVYVLTPQTENDAYPLGGHFRVEVWGDGRIGTSRSFTNSCLTIPAPKDKKDAVLTVTHLLDPVPTEIHVFTALTAHVPVAVVTSEQLVWFVTGDKIIWKKLD